MWELGWAANDVGSSPRMFQRSTERRLRHYLRAAKMVSRIPVRDEEHWLELVKMTAVTLEDIEAL
jgi:hypothetical protein